MTRHGSTPPPRPAWDRIESRADALTCVGQWLDALEQRRWPGIDGASRRAVAEALGTWALARGGVVFYASVAEIALEAGLSRPATRRALRALQAERSVRVAHPATAHTATVWRLEAPADDGAVPDDAVEHGPPTHASAAHGGLGEDWARWGGLGKRSALVWRSCVGGAAVSALAARDGVHPANIRRHLRRLERHGMVVYDPVRKLWTACGVEGAILPPHIVGTKERTAAAIAAARAGRRKR